MLKNYKLTIKTQNNAKNEILYKLDYFLQLIRTRKMHLETLVSKKILKRSFYYYNCNILFRLC